MSSTARSIGATVVLVALAGATNVLHRQARLAAAPPEEVPVLLLPDGDLLRYFTLGQRTAVSDLYWLRLVQYVGTDVAREAGYPQLEQLADLVTDLDPEHGYVYEIAGNQLSQVQDIAGSNRIFEKGMQHVPERWQLPFFAAFNHWYELGDLAKGAELLTRASRSPDAPKWMPRLIGTLYSTVGQTDAAMAYVELRLRQDGLPENDREHLLSVRRDLLLERTLRVLEEELASFERERGRKPSSLDELVGPRLPQLPVAPDGSLFDYDPATGEVSTPLLEVRLRYVRPDVSLEIRKKKEGEE